MKTTSLLLLLAISPIATADSSKRFIVQFREPPIARRSTAPSTSSFDESLARFRADFSRIEVAAMSPSGSGARIRREYFRAFHGASVELTRRESIGALTQLPYVARVYPDLDVEAFGGSPKRAEISAIVRHSASAGAGVVVAIIDTGIDYNHPALGGGIGAGKKVIGGYDFVNEDGDPMDDNRHGTHVAGIVAAESPAVTGIAPGASILAYKVLDDQGKGKQSDVIAAIERAVDPNGDGDLADHANVVNLSLGAPGSPDDPVAEAAENAVAAGLIVCAATGNTGLFHFVSSPAAAPSVIGVGASDAAGNLADFTSRGPATRSGAIKPDVVAPGVGILSTAIGGGTLVLTGTSMSTPYVSGLAAVLIADHREWTPARIKSAIVNTATPIANEEVMSQGAGRVNPTRADASSTAIEPTDINFGLDALGQNRWTTTETITVRNHATAARTFQVATSGTRPGIAVTADRATMTLGAGESGSVGVTVTVDNTTLPDAPSGSFAFGGLVTLTSPEETLRVPWAFLKAARAIVSYDLEFPTVVWVGNVHAASFAIIDLKTIETLLAPGEYDMLLTSIGDVDGRMIIREKQRIEGNVTINVKQADASHVITVDARDEHDAPFPNVDTPTTLYVPRARVIFDTPGGTSSLELPMVRTKVFRTSDVSSKYGLLFTESFIDGAAHRIYVAQHEVVRGVAADRLLVKNSGAYRSQTVSVRFPPDALRHDLGILARDVARRPGETGSRPLGVLTSLPEHEWVGTLLMTPEVHPDFASGIQLFQITGHAATRELASTVTPMLRLTDRGFISTRHFDPPPLPVEIAAGDRLAFPSGPAFPYLVMQKTPDGWGGQYDVYGSRDDLRRLDRATTTVRITDAAERQVFTGSLGPLGLLFYQLPVAGRHTARFVSADATTEVGFDTTRDATPPTLTSIALRDIGGQATTTFQSNGTGSLTFSVADYVITNFGQHEYRRVSPARVSVYFRRRAALTWTQLSVQQIAEDPATSGAVYRANLDDALRFRGDITLRFELTDDDENFYVHTIDSAFTVDEVANGRRRAVRH